MAVRWGPPPELSGPLKDAYERGLRGERARGLRGAERAAWRAGRAPAPLWLVIPLRAGMTLLSERERARHPPLHERTETGARGGAEFDTQTCLVPLVYVAVTQALVSRAGRARARRLGITGATAPRQVTPWGEIAGQLLLSSLTVRKAPRGPWRRLAAEIDEEVASRRSWKRALRKATEPKAIMPGDAEH